MTRIVLLLTLLCLAASAKAESILLASTERRTRPIPPSITPDRLVTEARSALDRMGSYQVLMHRQERVNGELEGFFSTGVR